MLENSYFNYYMTQRKRLYREQRPLFELQRVFMYLNCLAFSIATTCIFIPSMAVGPANFFFMLSAIFALPTFYNLIKYYALKYFSQNGVESDAIEFRSTGKFQTMVALAMAIASIGKFVFLLGSSILIGFNDFSFSIANASFPITIGCQLIGGFVMGATLCWMFSSLYKISKLPEQPEHHLMPDVSAADHAPLLVPPTPSISQVAVPVAGYRSTQTVSEPPTADMMSPSPRQ